MREIKFRAWNKVNKRFIYSDWKYGVVSFWDEIQNDFTNQYETTQEFTGLKDKNGIEIYEGDVLLDGERNRLVKWSNQNASFYMSHTDKTKSFYKEFIECGQSQSDGPVHCDSIEVIGNIYSNPELLNQK